MGPFGWLRRWSSRWFSWTAGGAGAADARNAHPGTQTWIEGELPGIDLERIENLVEQLREKNLRAGEIAAAGDGAPPDSPDDYSAVSSVLRGLLHSYPELASLSNDACLDLIHLLEDLHGVQAELSASGNLDGIRKVALTPQEATWLYLAEKEIEQVRRTWEENRHFHEGRARKIRDEMNQIRQTYRSYQHRHAAKDFREPHSPIPRQLYWPIIILIGIVELPLNAAAFRILRENDFQTFIYALAPTLSIIVMAHFLGMTLRQWPIWKSSLAATVSILLMIMGVLSVGFLRGEYIAHQAGEFSRAEFLALLGINFSALAAGTMASFLSHDPDHEVEEISSRKFQVRRRLNKLWDQWIRETASWDRLRGVTITKIGEIRNETRARMSEYRDYNWEGRGVNGGSSVPASFSTNISEHLFKRHPIGGEMDRPPGSLDEILADTETAS